MWPLKFVYAVKKEKTHRVSTQKRKKIIIINNITTHITYLLKLTLLTT